MGSEKQEWIYIIQCEEVILGSDSLRLLLKSKVGQMVRRATSFVQALMRYRPKEIQWRIKQSRHDENNVTLDLMHRYGIDKVRGGSWTTPEENTYFSELTSEVDSGRYVHLDDSRAKTQTFIMVFDETEGAEVSKPRWKTGEFWNNALSYSTVKIIKIADWRLGLLHYTFLFGIILYVFLYQVWYKRGYMTFETPSGAVRATLQAPPAPLPLNQLSYCSESGNSSSLPCAYMSGPTATFPAGQTSPLFITSRVKHYHRNLTTLGITCDNDVVQTNAACMMNLNDPSLNVTRAYIADLERYTLAIDHVAYALKIDFVGKSTDMKGVWTKKDDTTWSEGSLEAGRQYDIITLGDLLMLAGIDSLEAPSGVSGSKNSLRYDGVQLMVIIKYANTQSDAKSIKYHYSVAAISGIDTTRFDADTPSSAVNRHGISIAFVQSGEVGVFNFPALLGSIVSGLVLTGAATTIVDLLAVYVLPQKKHYEKAKFSTATKDKKMKESLEVVELETERPSPA
ncbi:P2X receptor [Planoprotostelium fungivorum]|uniref:P2X receptor n=1 Tax=Planoprotostelium fungivorum TaxID=1890364 RepID=A0A2P6MT00_9EUKA|nr:P2X receptor [Planoprotostelium fungivorum]